MRWPKWQKNNQDFSANDNSEMKQQFLSNKVENTLNNIFFSAEVFVCYIPSIVLK